jgi:hypothetical protein
MVTLLFAAAGTCLRLSSPEHAVPWYDEFRTLLHASGHTYESLKQLLQEQNVITAGEIQRRFLMPNGELGLFGALSLAQQLDPHNSPLYYGLVHLSLQTGVAPLEAARTLSAWLSVLLLPACFWLAWELFEALHPAWFSLALVAVAPVELYWAFDARCYGLWALAIACASAALLRAIKSQRRGWWVAYACFSTGAIYTHLLTLPVLAAHLTYVALRERPSIKAHAIALGSALGLAAPWLFHVAMSWQDRVAPQIGWTEGPRHASYWYHLSYAIGHGLWGSFSASQGESQWALGLGLGLTGAVVVLFTRRQWRGNGLLMLALLGYVLLPMAAMDLFCGGIRLAVFRYLVPASLALVVIFGGFFGHRPNLSKSAGAAALLLIATFHSWRATRDELPEGKWRSEPTTVAGIKKMLESASRPVVVSLGQVALPATLSTAMDPELPFLFLTTSEDWFRVEALDRVHEVFVLDNRHLPWYYEPYATGSAELLAQLRSKISLVPVARGLLRVRQPTQQRAYDQGAP